jgi:hypothetical protein
MNHFGAEIASKLTLVIKSLEKDFYSSDAKYVAPNLEGMGKMATEQFKKMHPELPDEIRKLSHGAIRTIINSRANLPEFQYV